MAEEDVFDQALGSKKVLVAAPTENSPWHGGGETLLAGIHIGGKAIGVLYVELSHPVEERQRGTFRQFSQQISLILTQAR